MTFVVKLLNDRRGHFAPKIEIFRAQWQIYPNSEGGRGEFQIHRGNDVQPLPLFYIVIMYSDGENTKKGGGQSTNYDLPIKI